ncbi:MAG: hypothetical protein OEY52_08935 [Gammaproteobacteria bacterium]|nr:hypothetical protein [Gammaproteobacteria bacterium]
MKLISIKHFVAIFALFLPLSVQAGLMDKKTLVEILQDTVDETVCIDAYTSCFNVSKTNCSKELKGYVITCVDDVPDDLEDMDEITSYSKSSAACAADKFKKKHNKSYKARINTPACAKFKAMAK